MNLTKPTFVVDADKAKKNIAKMSTMALGQGVRLRPHFKTHQNLKVGQWFREAGITAITVSSLDMAEFFAADGWKDITVAFSVNVNEVEQINALAAKIDLNLLLEDTFVVEHLERHLEHSVGAYIEIDTGYKRAGLAPDELGKIENVLHGLQASKRLKLKGFLTFPGHSYAARTVSEIHNVHRAYMEDMLHLREHFEKEFPGLEISVGDTPTCSVVENFKQVDEIRPGNFVYYDQMQLIIGSCSMAQIATIVACPIVAIHRERQEIIIFGGAVHFSKEQVAIPERGAFYGDVVELSMHGWNPEPTGAYLAWMTQEHGIIKAPKVFLEKVEVGRFIGIVPAHSCLSANLMRNQTTIINSQ